MYILLVCPCGFIGRICENDYNDAANNFFCPACGDPIFEPQKNKKLYDNVSLDTIQ